MEGTEEGVISVRPMSRVRLEERHPVQGGVKDVHHYRDASCVNNGAGVYGASATGCAYVHTLSSGYSSTESVGYSPGYGVGVASYGARRGGEGVAMKREEDEITVSFHEEDEEVVEAVEAEPEEEVVRKEGGQPRGGRSERM